MKLHKVEQGSDEWLRLRRDYFTASEAPAMMGTSPYKSRDALLAEKATGITEDVTPAMQYRFNLGHDAEEKARPLAEDIIGEELYNATGTKEVNGLPLLASFDGVTMMGDALFEHKLFNQKVAAMIDDENIASSHYWQLEQQLLVSGAKRVMFACSDGTLDTLHWCWYESDPVRRRELIAGWEQFDKDLQAYGDKPIQPEVIEAKGEVIMKCPTLNINLTGEIIHSNLQAFEAHALQVIEAVNTDLNTDQDFANAEEAVKYFTEAEKTLETGKKNALSQTVEIEQLFRTVDHLKDTMRKKRLWLNKLVTARKKERKTEMLQAAHLELIELIADLNRKLSPVSLPLTGINDDFAATIKGKSSFTKMQEAINDALAKAKIQAVELERHLSKNLRTYHELAADHHFLFNDLQHLISKDHDDLTALIKVRIGEHKEAEANRLEAERERIRQEEESKLEAQRQQIRREEQQKAQVEANRKEAKDLPFTAAQEPMRKEQHDKKIPTAEKQEDQPDLLYTEGEVTEEILTNDIHTIEKWVGQSSLDCYRFDQNGNEYHIELVIRRTGIKTLMTQPQLKEA
ncbi:MULTISPECIES: YqaJ viral recombinase family protein [unclassified Endozoicomonas]|uniref:YqaJ viral recombinase family protein n=1 Tax=unclassified Endozoicomonas TaxID=2644528 RepID=UPI003BB59C6F